jgi:hypothetical protein
MALHAVAGFRQRVAVEAQRLGPGDADTPVSKSVADLLVALDDEALRRAGPLDASCFVNALSSVCDEISPQQQQDVEEGFILMCSAIDSEVAGAAVVQHPQEAEAGPIDVDAGIASVLQGQRCRPCAEVTGFHVAVAFE